MKTDYIVTATTENPAYAKIPRWIIIVLIVGFILASIV